MSLILGEAPPPRAPSIERRQFVPWFTVNDRVLLADIEFGPELAMAACSLLDAHGSAALRLWVRRTLGLGLAIHPQLELLQLDQEFVESRDEKGKYRLQAFRELLREAVGDLDPRATKLGSQQAREASASLLQLEVSAYGTGLITGSFIFDDLAPRLLANNLALLDGAITEFAEENLGELTLDEAVFAMPRQLWASASIHVRLLREKRFVTRVIDELIDRRDGVYGYWVQVPGLDRRAGHATICEVRKILYPLQERAGRPVVSDRMGGFGLGFLAGGLAGYCVGTAAPEFASFPPTAFRPAGDPDAKTRTGFAFVAYNENLMRNFQLRGKWAGTGALAAHRFPCGGCGYHDPAKPPASNNEKKLHGFYWHNAQARELSDDAPEITARRFRRLVKTAAEASWSIGDRTPLYRALLETLPLNVGSIAEDG